jgi:ATP-binding cassette subfamily C protein CydC
MFAAAPEALTGLQQAEQALIRAQARMARVSGWPPSRCSC